MCENHLYWAGMHARSIVDANFDKGPRKFSMGSPRRCGLLSWSWRDVNSGEISGDTGWVGTRRLRWSSLLPGTLTPSPTSWLRSPMRGPMRRRCHCLPPHGSRALLSTQDQRATLKPAASPELTSRRDRRTSATGPKLTFAATKLMSASDPKLTSGTGSRDVCWRRGGTPPGFYSRW